MAAIRRIPVAWTTGPGGSGVSVFYSSFGTDPTVALAAYFNSNKAFFAPAVSWSVPSSGDVIEDQTGVLTGAWVGGTAATIVGTVGGSYAAGTGFYVNWLTGSVRAGHKFKGRTFMAPVVTTCYDTNGTITDSFLAQMQTYATTLAAAGVLRVWGRPTSKGASDGISAPIVAGQVPDRVTSLKTRRY